MSLNPGTKLGPYEILAPLGAGGMGEVYKAKDTRLDRTVAIKVLPSHVASNPAVRQRFEREARAVSSLNHPHICTLYDIGSENGVDFMVMEHIEGETLADRLKKGALPLDQALRHAIEVADALDKAHRQGVVHRDLKPSNIMLAKSGAKLLDFGLAKLLPEPSKVDSEMATVTKMTRDGAIVGTLQYMAPEQVEGKKADARTDIFAFGAVLYEMVTGRKAFEGKSQASLIAAILDRDPVPMATLQPMTPPALDHVVKTCLAKDPDDRWQTAADLGRYLTWIRESGSRTNAPALEPARERRSSRLARVVVASAMVVVAGTALWTIRGVFSSPPSAVFRFAAMPASSAPLRLAQSMTVALSPDGMHLVYVGQAGETSRLLKRRIDEREFTAIPGTEGASGPFFSPDGLWLGFFAQGRLKKVSFTGGAPVMLCDGYSQVGASWGAGDTIIFSQSDLSGLSRVSADGGVCEALTTLESSKGERSHRWPAFLPDGRHVMFTVETTNIASFDAARIEVLSLGTGDRRTILEGGTGGRYVPTGHLVYATAGRLLAAPFDLRQLAITGAPTVVMDDLIKDPGGGSAHFAVSESGTLVYLPGPGQVGAGSPLWVNRDGLGQPMTASRDYFNQPRLSPAGQRLAAVINGFDVDVWVLEIERDAWTRLTFEGDHCCPVWTPDGRHITFQSTRAGTGDIYWRPVEGDGTAEPLLIREHNQYPNSWSADGRTLAFTELHPTTGWDIWVLPRQGDPQPVIATRFNERMPMFSPGGRAMAYVSDQSGRDEVYVQHPGGTRLISNAGGTEPLWSADGRELFYREGNRLMVVSVTSGAAFTAGRPQAIFDGSYRRYGRVPNYDISRDGLRFVMIQDDQESVPAHINVVLNWFEELKRLVPKN